MAQEIVFYHSAMTGAPSNTLNAAGAGIAVMNAVLTDGFNSNTLSTLTQAAGVATGTTSGVNGFAVGDWVEIAGATPSAYNGRFKVVSKPATNQFTFAIASGTTSPASLSSATVKYPGAGWTKTAAGTNNMAYTAGVANGATLGLTMQVEDNNPYADSNAGMRTRQCQGWSALDTATVLGTQVNIHKLTGGWIAFADAKTAYFFFGVLGSTVKSFHFGEGAPFYSADGFFAIHSGGRTSTVSKPLIDEGQVALGSDFGGSNFPGFTYSNSDTGNFCYHLRGISQIGGSVISSPLVMPGSNCRPLVNDNFYAQPQNLFMPSLADNSIPIGPILMQEIASSVLTLRGRLRGVYFPLGKLASGFANGFQRLDAALIDGVSQSAVLMTYSMSGNRQLVFQVDGVWS